jgi:outer membrane protein OmpA-like peptidoglycan-associated protein
MASTIAFAASDPADAEKTADHPAISRFPGFFIDSAKKNDFNEIIFATQGYDGSGEPKGETKAGKYWFLDYCLTENARQPSGIELFRNYERAIKQAGGALVSRNPKTGWPEVSVFRMPQAGGSERWVQLNIDNDGARYQLTIIEESAMEQKLELSASEMADAMRKTGHVTLRGILFDTAQASIKNESIPLLNEVLALLRNDKSLRLAVEGHTDNVGNAKNNLDLSRRRADAIVSFLVNSGVTPQRLKAMGKGDTVPVADNRTTEGRQQNRRVELIKLL